MGQFFKPFGDWRVYASVLSADFLYLGENLKKVSPYVDGMHWDIMDGHYVPNLTLGPFVIEKARALLPNLWFDVHIMATPSEDIIKLFIDLPIQSLAFHPKTVKNPLTLIHDLHRKRIQAGFAINLEDDLSVWPLRWLNTIDYFLVMAVKPGFGGQKFNSKALQKISFLRRNAVHADILVDGGIVSETAKLSQNAGACGVISGQFIFHKTLYEERGKILKNLKAE
ncbi:ribulose-phosphate 3-epimerase [Holospora elegans E1]|uniref:Ribulose-phosphate 3-epimerase n=1 Tax=Holospora elegans E1 TaxID=1427503 RepID=A0A023DXH6_9PROT|nr:ribulose-phosphate 3-epimerase [Holospora elegans]GAJ46098.1 ribulose-phosphate 3-epimerase [Holospora elegans E1]